MIISQTMNLRELLALTGQADIEQARQLRTLLVDSDHTTTDDIPEDEWESLLDDAEGYAAEACSDQEWKAADYSPFADVDDTPCLDMSLYHGPLHA